MKKKTTVLLPYLFLLLFPGTISAQSASTGGAAGYVVDAETGEPLIGANITVVGTQSGAASNRLGYFVITRLAPGEYWLRASYIGYEARELKVRISPGEFVKVRFRLTPRPLEMGRVEVTADRFAEEEKNVSTIAMPAARLRNMATVAESDLLRALQLLPGVQGVNELSSGLYIRGGSPDQNLILLDGATVYNPSHLFGFFSTFNTDAISDVKLIKGGYPAEYGGRLSAVLDIDNRNGNRRKVEGRGSVSMISSRLLVEGPLPGGSFMVSGRRTYLDLLLALSSADDLPHYYFYDWNAKLTFLLGERDRLIFSSYLGNDNLDYAAKKEGKTSTTIHINWGNRIFSGRWVHFLSPQLMSTLQLSASGFASKVNANARGLPILFSTRIHDVTLKSDVEWFASPAFNFKSGLNVIWYRFANRAKVGENTGFDNRLDERPTAPAAYVQGEWKPSPLWVIAAGLRLNHFSIGNHTQLDPRLQIRYRLSSAVTLKASAGTYTQYTTVVSNDVASFADIWYPIDDTIDPLRSQQYILGVDWRPEGPWSISVETYYKPMQNVVEFKPRQDTNRDRLDEIFYIGDGLARGIEIFLEKSRGRLTGWLGYSWSRTTRKFSQLNRGRTFPAKWDFTHDFVATMKVDIGRGWKLGSTFVYKSGATYTVPTGRYRLGAPHFPINYIRPGQKNGQRLEPYHRLDLFLSHRWSWSGFRGNVNFNIFNVYNHRNVWYRDYRFSDDSPVPEIVDVRLLPLVPTVEIGFRF